LSSILFEPAWSPIPADDHRSSYRAHGFDVPAKLYPGLSCAGMEISAPTIVESNKRDIPLSVRVLDRFSSPITVTLAAAVILIERLLEAVIQQESLNQYGMQINQPGKGRPRTPDPGNPMMN